MATHKLEEEVNASTGVSFGLDRPDESYIYRVLSCDNCGNDTNFEISLADNGQWAIECLACNDAANTLQEILAALK